MSELAHTHYRQAMSCLKVGRTQQARDLLEKAAALTPADGALRTAVFAELASIYEKIGRSDLAAPLREHLHDLETLNVSGATGEHGSYRASSMLARLNFPITYAIVAIAIGGAALAIWMASRGQERRAVTASPATRGSITAETATQP